MIATTKAIPFRPRPAVSAIGTQGWSLLDGDLPLPLAVIRDSALAHNHAWMRDFTAATGVLLAPHGKTTMAPQIFAQQLAAGAWGMTVANVQQLGICTAFGVRRVLMANQLLGALEVRTVIGLLRRHADLEFHVLVARQPLAAIEAAAPDPPAAPAHGADRLAFPAVVPLVLTHDAAARFGARDRREPQRHLRASMLLGCNQRHTAQTPHGHRADERVRRWRRLRSRRPFPAPTSS